ncbi:MAG: FAD-dependent oxidoreductase [Acidobacteriia bacterium]|nr:FAD-dependent oxidoreductase [Terriglobia bacterium]
MAFWFEKPPTWTFKAGQFIDVTLIDPPETDAEGDTREFSIASAPSEPAIMVATRLRDTAFKRVLRDLALNTQVRIEGPFGDLVLHNNVSRPAVFLSGGIGITPLRSILVRAARERLPHRLFLFYANRRPEDAPFLDDIRMLERENPNFTFVPTMTEMANSRRPWQGETGRIDQDLLNKYLKNLGSAIYYITGPAGMVSGMRQLLNRTGIDDDDIRTEEFSGY